ncbi:MAG: helix-turn-helix transcriptional regulator [Rhodospirillales bacterium]|nr:helix-turn-helix transcriptional regulator [Rhodospirillales bacterium]
MTPFGQKIRALRKRKQVSLKRMAADLGVSSAYFSALEHGHRGRPGSGLVQQICGYFDLMWDDAEALDRLAQLSHPRVVVDTAGLTANATLLANMLSEKISTLDEETIEWVLAEIDSRNGPFEGPTH